MDNNRPFYSRLELFGFFVPGQCIYSVAVIKSLPVSYGSSETATRDRLHGHVERMVGSCLLFPSCDEKSVT